MGLYMAESSSVIRRAIEAGHRPRSFLMAERWLPDLADLLGRRAGADGAVPVFVAEADLLREITGFTLHRGALAAMHRPALPPVADLLSGRRGGPRACRDPRGHRRPHECRCDLPIGGRAPAPMPCS